MIPFSVPHASNSISSFSVLGATPAMSVPAPPQAASLATALLANAAVFHSAASKTDASGSLAAASSMQTVSELEDLIVEEREKKQKTSSPKKGSIDRAKKPRKKALHEDLTMWREQAPHIREMYILNPPNNVSTTANLSTLASALFADLREQVPTHVRGLEKSIDYFIEAANTFVEQHNNLAPGQKRTLCEVLHSAPWELDVDGKGLSISNRSYIILTKAYHRQQKYLEFLYKHGDTSVSVRRYSSPWTPEETSLLTEFFTIVAVEIQSIGMHTFTNTFSKSSFKESACKMPESLIGYISTRAEAAKEKLTSVWQEFLELRKPLQEPGVWMYYPKKPGNRAQPEFFFVSAVKKTIILGSEISALTISSAASVSGSSAAASASGSSAAASASGSSAAASASGSSAAASASGSSAAASASSSSSRASSISSQLIEALAAGLGASHSLGSLVTQANVTAAVGSSQSAAGSRGKKRGASELGDLIVKEREEKKKNSSPKKSTGRAGRPRTKTPHEELTMWGEQAPHIREMYISGPPNNVSTTANLSTLAYALFTDLIQVVKKHTSELEKSIDDFIMAANDFVEKHNSLAPNQQRTLCEVLHSAPWELDVDGKKLPDGKESNVSKKSYTILTKAYQRHQKRLEVLHKSGDKSVSVHTYSSPWTPEETSLLTELFTIVAVELPNIGMRTFAKTFSRSDFKKAAFNIPKSLINRISSTVEVTKKKKMTLVWQEFLELRELSQEPGVWMYYPKQPSRDAKSEFFFVSAVKKTIILGSEISASSALMSLGSEISASSASASSSAASASSSAASASSSSSAAASIDSSNLTTAPSYHFAAVPLALRGLSTENALDRGVSMLNDTYVRIDSIVYKMLTCCDKESRPLRFSDPRAIKMHQHRKRMVSLLENLSKLNDSIRSPASTEIQRTEPQASAEQSLGIDFWEGQRRFLHDVNTLQVKTNNTVNSMLDASLTNSPISKSFIEKTISRVQELERIMNETLAMIRGEIMILQMKQAEMLTQRSSPPSALSLEMQSKQTIDTPAIFLGGSQSAVTSASGSASSASQSASASSSSSASASSSSSTSSSASASSARARAETPVPIVLNS